MSSIKSFYSFLSDGVSFRSIEAMRSRLIYAPLCGTDGAGIKSAITPFLSGDIKIDKAKYLTRPMSREDLRDPVRNLFLRVLGKGLFSFDDESLPAEASCVEVGQLWHKVIRIFAKAGLQVEATSFVPVSGEALELTRFTIRNVIGDKVSFIPTLAVPIFGRALANKHDHEHVTALLKRTSQLAEGVVVEPTMIFNEEGHKLCSQVYYVFGCDGAGKNPLGTFPTVEDFFGEGGSLSRPAAVLEGRSPRLLSEAERHGKEAVGGLAFPEVTLKSGDSIELIMAVGIADNAAAAQAEFSRFASSGAVAQALQATQDYWTAKTGAVVFSNSDKHFTSWMRWVALQPILRRIFGCSFLPDHDYGKGGKGWRDIWQDLLSLILIEPGEVRSVLLNNFSGVRVDGSNATIIGQKPGEFMADRNAITRVWMDHGVWPFLTTLLYINQSGDLDFLFEKTTYFCDPQMSRSMERNIKWTSQDGNMLKDRSGTVCFGTVLEHILIQNLVQFFNVGEHNITRLESADWNDGLDMAFKRGESVAFMSIYAGNLARIADLLERVAKVRDLKLVQIACEVVLLLDTLGQPMDYDNADQKRARLFNDYFKAVHPVPSWEVVDLPIADVVSDLRKKAAWVFAHIRRQEKVTIQDQGTRFSWFNGYYDNDGQRVEGQKDGRIWMTLTGQVFPLISGLATKEDAKDVVCAVRQYLRDPQLGGYRLNTDFGLRHYLSLGRAFGFAFGTKENGAVFSHMVVMYSYGLYVQGFAREGYEVLRSLYMMSIHPQRARIYPGVPEYFDSQGRGMYHFLTGSASWYVLTLLTQAFGVRGLGGDLILAPQLVAEEFDAQGQASVSCQFAGKRLTVVYLNQSRLDHGSYKINTTSMAGALVIGEALAKDVFCIPASTVATWPVECRLEVILN